MTPPLIAPADCAYGTPVILESFGREPFDALRAVSNVEPLSRTVRACLLGRRLKRLGGRDEPGRCD